MFRVFACRLMKAGFLAALLLSATARLAANDNEARAKSEEAYAAGQKGDWRSAGNRYMDAKLLADDAVIKANALKLAARAYRKAEMGHKEYLCLRELLDDYPEEVNFEDTVRREYQIANSYLKGYRDRPYRWVPWLKDEDRTQEIYEAILQQAPYIDFAPRMLLRLAEIYVDKNEFKKADETYNRIIDAYSTSYLAPVAYLDKANLAMQLARSGDGDGTYSRSTKDTLKDYIKLYPRTPEERWAKENLLAVDEVSAERLYKLAVFYNREKNPEAARRYIRDTLVNYPDSAAAPKAERLLADMDKNYRPKLPTDVLRSKYPVGKIPATPEKLFPVPAADKSKWLIQPEDLEMQGRNTEGPMHVNVSNLLDSITGTPNESGTDSAIITE